MNEHKRELLRRAWKDGLVSFLRELSVMARDKLCGATHLVYELRKQDYQPGPIETGASLALCSYRTWDAVPEGTRAAIARDLHDQYWGKEQWLPLGWRMWTASAGGELAAVSWTREAGQCEDFFFPVSGRGAMIWQTVTVPAFRGKGLCAALWKRMLRELFENGNESVYISCREFNLASRKAIEKAGFRHIGRGFIRKRTGQGVWYPVVRPFTQG